MSVPVHININRRRKQIFTFVRSRKIGKVEHISQLCIAGPFMATTALVCFMEGAC